MSLSTLSLSQAQSNWCGEPEAKPKLVPLAVLPEGENQTSTVAWTEAVADNRNARRTP